MPQPDDRRAGLSALAPAVVRHGRRYALGGGLLLLPFFLFMSCVVASSAETPSNLALALSLTLAILPAGFYARLVLMLDRNEREPRLVLLGAFFWGALVATSVALLLNIIVEVVAGGIVGDPEVGMLLTAWLGAPVTEELAKGAALLLLFLFLRDEFDNLLDGVVYGGLVGIGFALTENVLYFLKAYGEGQMVAVGGLFYLRAIVSGLNHAAFTAFTGVGFGWAREARSWPRTIWSPLAGLVFAMLGHALWNIVGASVVTALAAGTPTLVYYLVVMPLAALALVGPGLAVILLLVGAAWRREAKIIREHLQAEVQRGVIDEGEYARLCSTKDRLAAERKALATGGRQAWRNLRELHEAAVELAFHNWHQSQTTPRGKAEGRGSADYYRERIASLRELGRAGASAPRAGT